MKTKRITIADIAEKSGYSKTAVSFAFNCPERISKEAAEKILRIAQELNYFPDPMARNFSLGRHLSIGFLVPQSISEVLANPHSIDILKGIGRIAETYSYTVTLIPPLHSSIPEAIRNATVDGLISLGLEYTEEIKESLQRRRLPLVSIDGTNDEDLMTITIDDYAASKLQLETVLSHGHRKLGVIALPSAAYIGEYQGTGVSETRSLGYRDAIQEAGMDPAFPEVTAPASILGGRDAARKLLKENPEVTCLICMSDIQALGAIEAIRETGRNVPDDISVVGFDGILDSTSGQTLATITQNGLKKGEKAAETLFEMIKGNTPEEEHSLIPFSYTEGSTLKAI